MIDNTKDVVHRCGSCNTVLGRWYSVGKVEVSDYATIALGNMPSKETRADRIAKELYS